ncbi:MAG TPA: hypothetical protein PLC47_04770, partial [Bacteroidales bacterium]|nr:hypothetical protein [Bacteroidales bacterium]
MKKSILLLIAIFGFLIAHTQITITSSDMPAIGDTVRTSTAFDTDGYDFSRTGEDFNWNFGDLIPISQRVDTFLAVTSTPVVFWPFFLSSADLVNTFNPATLLPGLPDTRAYRFLESSSSRYQDLGYGLIYEGTPIPLKYNDPDEWYQFPMNYGQAYSDEAALEMALPGVGYVLIERNRQNTIDGWGSLTTPYGTFEVLRYKSEVSEYDSLEMNGIGQGIYRDYTEYHWLAEGMAVPLLQATIDEMFGTMVVYRDSARIINVGMNEKQPAISTLSIFPNPVSQSATFRLYSATASTACLTVFDQQGKL